ncbi:mucin-2-like [Pectinophora gossypiella]|nr:mucin-2-like [Pectinophora gossypiella]
MFNTRPSLELEASARLEETTWDVTTPAASAHACAEEGGVFAAGSALAGRAACERCYCLRGARRCVRPRCLPPPRACRARPAPGACCPDRYYCDSDVRNLTTATPLAAHGQHDCEVNGKWVPEGERVSAPRGDECSSCFCLRGRVRCQAPACAPPLHGCAPLLRPGHCCPHQYHCPHSHHSDPMASLIPAILDNALVSTRFDERSFRTSASTKPATTTHTVAASALTTQTASAAPAPTTKVKRKTNDPPPPAITHKPSQNSTKTTPSATTVATVTTEPTTTTESTAATDSKSTSTEGSTTALYPEQTATEQPEGSVKIIINGTINCTAELTSTPMLTTVNDTDRIQAEANPRTPYGSGDGGVEAQTASPSDIITDRGVGAGFDDDGSFTVNVTSSLRANTSRPLAAAPPRPPPSPDTPPDPEHPLNISKKTKEDYDYDYTEPTLPPSLPNLKIIPFVAADAVVDEDVSSKDDSLSYPALEREDKFPVYYPGAAAGAGAGREATVLATRREDVLGPTQYPVFMAPADVSSLPGAPAPPPPAAATSQPATKPATTTTTRGDTITTPALNLFSPPVETEGGFIPKGPGIIAEYYAVYPSTPPPAPHLTTSMQINPINTKSECVSSDGQRIPAGGSVWRGCSVCACAWGRLACAPRRCAAPPPLCRRRAATRTDHDLCCGEIVCDYDNATTSAPILSTRRTEITLNVTKIPIEIESDLIPFDPPPDRSVPAVSDEDAHGHKHTDMNKLDDITASIPTTEGNAFTTPSGETVKQVPTNETSTTPTPTVMSSTVSTVTTSTPTPDHKEANDTSGQSQEYEDEDDDEGFSFGSVLKLLLSDSYDTTPVSASKKRPATIAAKQPATTSTTVTPTPTSPPPSSFKPPPTPTLVPFIPIQPHPYLPSKKLLPQNMVNRIDHLVLGEATAIKRTTSRPASSPPRRLPARPSTRKPTTTPRAAAVTTSREPPEYAPAAAAEPARPVSTVTSGGGGGGGLLKLAGCNIYGRMYRVGRIIAELSTPCQECRCTELGVQCMPLHC